MSSPKFGSSIGPAQISAAAAGMTRNGVMISVRTTPRPMNFLSSSTASAIPRAIAKITASAVIVTDRQSAARKLGSVKTSL